jgi:hypothetical protein
MTREDVRHELVKLDAEVEEARRRHERFLEEERVYLGPWRHAKPVPSPGRK